jgi:hypothetical protein
MVMVKKLSLVAIGAVTLLLILVGSSSEAEADMYIKIGDIKGEALDKDHTAWSDLMSFSQTIRLQDDVTISPGETRRRGDVVLEDIVVSKELDQRNLIKQALNLQNQFCRERFSLKSRFI